MIRSTLSAILLTIFLAPTLVVGQTSTKEKLQAISQTPEIAAFFDGIFEDLGLIIGETGERLTLHHTGEKITIEEGLDEDAVDLVLPLNLKDIKNIGDFSKDGKFSELEAAHITTVFFTPFTRQTLRNEVLAANRKRRAAGIEDVIHVTLLFPDSTVARQHTLIYVPGQWVVIEGLHGQPQRTFTVTQGPALEYQRRLTATIKADTKKGWLNFLKWYRGEWSDSYSVKN